jgi:predicted enzyme related to lactoylglutathione lyase
MSERDGYQPGVPCWIDTLQPDPEAAARFYAGVFGWEVTGPGAMPGDPPGQYFVARLRGRDVAGIGSQPAEGAPASWNTYVEVASADEAAAKARDAGGAVLVDPMDAPPAGRLAVLADPAGALVGAWEPGVRKGAQLVNEPGAWSISRLSTTDPDGAKAFYGAVFGWETGTFAVNGGEITLWRVPGYVGGTPEQPVSRDVVGVMGGVEGGAPPNWSVDFWVGDADGTARKAAELGGAVVVEPFDIPGFRTAVLADPQGAAFSISELKAGS